MLSPWHVALGLSISPLLASAADANALYTPAIGTCPGGFTLIRSAGNSSNQTLSTGESSYLSSRKSGVLPNAWKAYLANVQATNVTLPGYVSSLLSNSSGFPTLGIATSGGGYRAAIFGAGVLNALDGRNGTSAKTGTGGLLQAASYLAGLSGGSWLLSSLVQADFPPIQDLVFGPSTGTPGGFGGWVAQVNLLLPSGNPADDAEYLSGLVGEVQGKRNAGFAVTINDIWARALARHFANGTTAGDVTNTSLAHGAGITFSGVTNLSTFSSFQQPFPIIVADVSSKGGNTSTIMSADGDLIPLTNPLFEFNVYETGSFDPVLASFTPTQFLGTTNTTSCITGYDQISFVSGTSSELFNELNTTLSSFLNSAVGPIVQVLNSTIPQPGVELDVARYPNPFFGVANGTYVDSNQEFLSLVDGGEDGEVIPIQPLLVKARGVDTIFAIDATSDVNNYAAGSALIATQNRSSLFSGAYSFPSVPTSTSAFLAANLTTRPTFFGCNDSAPTPLLVYFANGGAPPGSPAITNTSTTQIQYDASTVQAMLDQTFTIATQGRPAGGGTGVDPQWPACLACAVVDRSRARAGVERSGVCTDCFSRYCFNATELVGSSPKKSAATLRYVVGNGIGGVLSLITILICIIGL